MASHSFFPIISLVLLLLISLSSALTENTIYESSTSSDIVECGSRLLQLAACAPFVQGSVPAPAHLCCDNLIDLDDQEPNCLCILLNDTTFTSFPINKTLALQLPGLCKLKLNTSTCPGLASSPGGLPETQVSHGSDGPSSKSSSTAVSPVVAMAPKSNLGFGLHHNAGQKLKIIRDPFVAVVTVFLLIRVLSWF